MAEAEDNPWREKYLNALDEQERLELQQAEQTELLKRALVRVSLAAEGLDEGLDDILETVRATLREGQLDRLESTLETLEDSILSYDQQRQSQHQQGQQAMLRLLSNLQPISRGERKLAKELKASLQEPAKTTRVLVEQLQSLSNIAAIPVAGTEEFQPPQAVVSDDSPLSSTENHRAGSLNDTVPADVSVVLDSVPLTETVESLTLKEGLLGRLFKRDQRKDKASDEALEQSAEVFSGRPLKGSLGDGDKLAEALEGQFQSSTEVLREDARREGEQKPVHEPEFSRVSDKVHVVLADLLDQVEPADSVVEKALNARERLDNGLTWYELVPTLEDIRDLVLQAYLAADEDYRQYLLAVDESLQQILSVLGLASADLRQRLVVEKAFEETLSKQLGSFSDATSQVDEVAVLKQLVADHLGSIEQALREKRESIVTDEVLEAQLATLSDRVKKMEVEATATHQELSKQKQKAMTDTLTGLPNREAYTQRLFHEYQRWQRHDHPLTLAICDIDHFKKINDSFGHQAGDRVLQVLAKGLGKRLRDIDFVGRYGGEEFVVLLPDTNKGDAWVLLDKIREAISKTAFRFNEKPLNITFSIGVSQFVEGDSAEAVFARADKLLYQAKADGRNRCLVD